MKDSFVIYPTFVESIRKLPAKSRLEVYEALMDYGMTNAIPEGISAVTEALITSFAMGVDNAKKRREASIENGKKGGEFGHLGGRPRKTPSEPLNVNKNVKSYMRHEYKEGELDRLVIKLD